MGFLDDYFKKSIERRNGRIWYFPGNWVFEPTEHQIKKSSSSGHLHTSEDATGKPMYLISQKGTNCPNADKCDGKYPKSKEHATWWIPWYECKKCEYHQKGRRRGTPRYPCCKYIASKFPEKDAALDTLNALKEAKEFADSIFT